MSDSLDTAYACDQIMTVPLTRGYTSKVNSVDYGLVSQYKWFADIRKKRSGELKVYATTTVYVNGKKTSLRMHALILKTMGHGHKKIGEHKNGDGTDNCRDNIRQATQLQNMQNITAMNGRKFKGVTYQKRLTIRPWQSKIQRNGVIVHLGYFPNEEEAALAYNKAAELSDGEFLLANKVRSGVSLSDNFLRDVLSSEKVVNEDRGGHVLVFKLSCGHTSLLKWCKRKKLGITHHCKQCMRESL